MLGFLKYPRFGRATHQSATPGLPGSAEVELSDAPIDPVLDGDGEVIDHPRLVELYRYWDAKREGRDMPARSDIDPAEIRHLLPNMVLIEVQPDPLRYRYRLVGTELVAILGEDLTGKYLDQMPLLFRRFAGNAYAELIARRAPTYAVFDTHIPMFRTVRYKRLMLPLSSDGETINMVAAGFFRF